MAEVEEKFGRRLTCAFEKENTRKKTALKKKHSSLRRGIFMKLFQRVEKS